MIYNLLLLKNKKIKTMILNKMEYKRQLKIQMKIIITSQTIMGNQMNPIYQILSKTVIMVKINKTIIKEYQEILLQLGIHF